MKKLTVLLLSIFILLLSPTPTFASSFINSNKIITLGPDEVVDHNYYASGETVEILGTINGDAYVFGGQIYIDGDINGDLITAGGSVNISGNVAEDLRVAGGQVTILGSVGKNLSVAGGNIDIASTASVGNALHAAGGNLTIASPITAEALIAGGNLNLNSPIGSSLEARVGNLRLSPQTSIAGDLDYWADEVSISEEASVSGTTTRHELPESVKPPSEKDVASFMKGFSLITKFTSLLTTLILGLLLIKFFPNCAKNHIEIVRSRLWASLGFGLVAIILIPIIAVAFIFTGFGIPLSLMTLNIYLLFIYFARLYVILTLGKLILDRLMNRSSLLSSLLAGLVVYYLLSMIVFIGTIIKLLTVIAGFGAGLLGAKQTYRLARDKKVY